MNDWLIGLSSRPPTDEEVLSAALKEMSATELNKLAFDLDPLSFQTRAESLREKLSAAERNGRELAHENSSLDKIAFIPALVAGAARLAPLAGRAVGALGGAKGIVGGVAKDMAIGAAANKVMGALKPAAPAAAAAGEVAGGFKYAFAGGLMQRAAGYVVKNPGTALTAAGAVGGAMMAPRDPQTGQKQYLKGALVGGVGAAGVNAVSNGAIANRLRSSVMNRNSPLLGQGTRKYLMDAAASTKGKVPGVGGGYTKAPTAGATTAAAASAPTTAVPSSPAVAPAGAAQPPPATPTSTPVSPYNKGPVTGTPSGASGQPYQFRWGMGFDEFRKANRGALDQAHQEYIRRRDQMPLGPSKLAMAKNANQQTLTYDPATKTFTRQHLTSSPGSADVRGTGAQPIPAGHTELVRNSGTGMAPYGSKEYLQARMKSTGVGSAPAHQSTGQATAAPPALPSGRSSRWEANEGMGLGRPMINKKPAALPGRIGGVAGIGAAAAKPKALSTMAGLSLARR